MTAIVAILGVSQDAARAMLPAGLDLAAQSVTTGERHPVVLILGHQSNVRPRLLPFGAEYLEFILALPFVQRRAGRELVDGPFCYPARLYLDRRLPTVAGRLLYAYDKRRAALRMTEGSYSVAESADAEPLLEAHFRTGSPALESSPIAAARLFELPVISQAPRGWRYDQRREFFLNRA